MIRRLLAVIYMYFFTTYDDISERLEELETQRRRRKLRLLNKKRTRSTK